MTKPYYESQANHAFRFYVRNPVLRVKSGSATKCEIADWNACNLVYKMLTPEEQIAVTEIYRSKGYMPDIVRAQSSKLKVGENRIWSMLNYIAQEFAKKRGLKS